MGRFLLRRFLLFIPQIALVIVGIFFLLRVLPVDPVARIVGTFASPEIRRATAHQIGSDRPILAQLRTYLDQLTHGSFGISWVTSSSVSHEIAERFPVTLQLIGLAFLVSLTMALILGTAAAYGPGRRLDKSIVGYALFAGAQPDFWWGLMFIFIFFYKLGIFPAPLGILSPYVTPPRDVTHFILIDSATQGNWTAFWDALWHLALPVLTLSFVLTGPLIKMTRQSVLGVSTSEFILYAKAAGLPRRTVQGYMLRTAVAPVVTLAGVLFGYLLGGAALIETVFTLDGLGRYAVQRTLAVDYPSIQGAVIVMTVFSLGMYLLMDILYALLDPRVRYARG
jgi:ABC-type dipeptide/oligopeptide/nickel transport system permease component